MLKDRFKISFILSVIIIVLAIILSAGGIFMDGLYQDNAYNQSVLYGNDLVTLVIVLPLMIGSLFFTMKGSYKAQFIWLGSLFYMFYNYMFYLFGCSFNNFFLLYTTLVSLSIYSIIFSLIKIDVQKISQKFDNDVPVKLIGGFMIFIALSLVAVDISQIINFIITRQLPQHIIDYEYRTSIIFAIDLSILLPTMVLSAIWLLKRQVWGYILSAIMLFKTSTYGLALVAMTFTSNSEGYDPLIYFYFLLWLGGAFFLVSLLKSMKSLE